MKARPTMDTKFKEAIPRICRHFGLKRRAYTRANYSTRDGPGVFPRCVLYTPGGLFSKKRICSIIYDGDSIWIRCSRETKDTAEKIGEFIEKSTDLGKIRKISY